MTIAKYLCKPVISVIPKNTHHRKTNVIFDGVKMEDWIHPFLWISSDYIAESIEDATVWVRSYMDAPDKTEIKDISIYEAAIAKWEQTKSRAAQ